VRHLVVQVGVLRLLGLSQLLQIIHFHQHLVVPQLQQPLHFVQAIQLLLSNGDALLRIVQLDQQSFVLDFDVLSLYLILVLLIDELLQDALTGRLRARANPLQVRNSS